MRLRPRLTYANVVATLALFFAFTGGAVYAANNVKVRSSQIAARAVSTAKIAPGAVKRGKIFVGAVGAEQLADGAVTGAKVAPGAIGSAQVEDGSISRADLKEPVGFVASPTGGSLALSNQSQVPYPLAGNTWRANAGEFDVIFGQIAATLRAADGDTCNVQLALYVNDTQAGGGWMQSNSSKAEQVKTGLGSEPRINFDSPSDQVLEIKVDSNGCAAGSSIDSSRIRVLGIG